jgi:hypothetical protein
MPAVATREMTPSSSDVHGRTAGEGPWQSAAAEQRLAAIELAQEARALTERARALRIARQQERAALAGTSVRLLALLRAADPAPVAPVGLSRPRGPAVPAAERLAA